MKEEDIEKEINEILLAIENGSWTYTLRYCSNFEFSTKNSKTQEKE